MNKPINFETVDRVDLELQGNPFYFDVDHMQNYQHSNWVWVFCNGQALGDYCVLFQFKWEHNCYSMKRCVLGEGDTGDYIFQDNLLSADMVKTKDTFVNHIAKVIEKAIGLGKFQN